MIESLFYALVVVSAVTAGLGITFKKGAIVAFGGLLFMMCGLLIMGSTPTSGIERDMGEFVRHVGDGNYNIDVNTWFLNASNDFSLSILSLVFFYGGLSIILASFAIMVSAYRKSKRGR